ncbi:AraC family transcriptional regulator [Vibrio vulnificus]|nr:AraC family transcriptional regulator [Vibrio vulnificus]EGR0107236.1 AraC family transcriptional regulator [Vibrio vulnificus]
MSHNINTTSSSNLLPFIRYFEKNSIDWKAVSDQYQIPHDIQSRQVWLSSQQLMSFLMAMVRHSNKKVGLEVGKLITLSQISPALESNIRRCGDLSQAIETVIQMIPELSSHVVIWVEQIHGDWYLCHRGAYHPSTLGFDQAEWFRSYALLSMCRLFLGKEWVPEHVYMSFSKHLAQGLPFEFSNTRFSFDHPFGAIKVELDKDYQPISLTTNEVDWVERIKRLSHTYAMLPWFTVDWFAGFLHMSSRTLQRKLAEKGLSLKELRDEARVETAKQLLQEKMTPEEVAWCCGYNDLSNFNRAFRRWTGITPAQYRASNKKSA